MIISLTNACIEAVLAPNEVLSNNYIILNETSNCCLLSFTARLVQECRQIFNRMQTTSKTFAIST